VVPDSMHFSRASSCQDLRPGRTRVAIDVTVEPVFATRKVNLKKGLYES
jgi:hypothetical protein